MPRLVRAALACAAMLSWGCGGSGGGTIAGDESVVLLDGSPGAVHAGLYVATARGFDDAEGAPLGIRPREPGADPARLLETGEVRLAVLDIHDLALARARGADLVAVMALVQRPLTALAAGPGIDRPRRLEGRRAGLTGGPADAAVLRSVVAGDGGEPGRVRQVRVGGSAVRALLRGRVDATTVSWHDEGVTLRRRPGVRFFHPDDFGAPAYPGLVLAVTRATLEDARSDVEAVVRTVQRGYEEVAIDPESAVQAMLAAGPVRDARKLTAGLDAVAPAFEAGTTDVGRLHAERLAAWARWAVRHGVLQRRPDVDRAFDVTVAGVSGRD